MIFTYVLTVIFILPAFGGRSLPFPAAFSYLFRHPYQRLGVQCPILAISTCSPHIVPGLIQSVAVRHTELLRSVLLNFVTIYSLPVSEWPSLIESPWETQNGAVRFCREVRR